MLTLAEVCELQPGDEQNATWINPGTTAYVKSIVPRNSRQGKKMWPCMLHDPDTGAEAEMTLFSTPKFSIGDHIEVSGQGLRRTEYNGKAQISVGKNTSIHILTEARKPPFGSYAPPAEKPTEPTAFPAREPVDAQPMRTIFGATVGAAINQSMEVFRYIYTPAKLEAALKTPEFWADLHTMASDFCRVALILENGKVAPKIKARVVTPQSVDQPKPKLALQKPAEEEDVPF